MGRARRYRDGVLEDQAVEVDLAAAPPQEVPLPALTLRDGLPSLTDTANRLAAGIAALRAGSGPIALDTERASGYRYSQRAYLIQIRREGAGTHLIDPIAVPGVPGLADALSGPDWILHAASQDLPCLAELDLRPTALFDTELAGRLLGMPRVGLAAMVEELLGHTLAKGHGAADWSRRPLPDDWLEYAALDVEVLIELREELHARLAESGKLAWALEEFAALCAAEPGPGRADPWRRTSGIHRVRTRRGLAIVEALWLARDQVARQADIAPGRLLPDSSIVAAAQALPRDPAALRELTTFHGRGARRYQRDWGRALHQAWELPEEQLPQPGARSTGPPPARTWANRDPVAAGRLERARAALAQLAEQLNLPVENLVTPELVRRLAWDPMGSTHGAVTDDGLASFLREQGAREWQVQQVAGLLAGALRRP